MRRRRKLEVSTFPFLAVLLCAMGSLILVLLAMDRKAKLAAKVKAELAARKVAEDAELLAAARRAEWERARQERRTEWERKRDSLHTKLESDKRNLEGQMAAIRARLADSAAQLQAELDGIVDLERKAEAEKGKIGGAAKALAEKQATAERFKAESAAQQAALEKMTADLALLENTLRDLKAARERERQTYSVVPYKGRRGESRRPLYIECASAVVIFHPDKMALSPERGNDVRTEVLRRVTRQKEIIQTGGEVADTTPYLMLLIRPDGIPAYYQFQAALRGMEVRFGYEFIDADWILDFPADDAPAENRPWSTIARSGDTPPAGTSAKQPSPRGVVGLRPTGVPLSSDGGSGTNRQPGNVVGLRSQGDSSGGAPGGTGGASAGGSSGVLLPRTGPAGSGNGFGSGAGGGSGTGGSAVAGSDGVHGLFPGSGTGTGGTAIAGQNGGNPGGGGVPGGGPGGRGGVGLPGSGGGPGGVGLPGFGGPSVVGSSVGADTGTGSGGAPGGVGNDTAGGPGRTGGGVTYGGSTGTPVFPGGTGSGTASGGGILKPLPTGGVAGGIAFSTPYNTGGSSSSSNGTSGVPGTTGGTSGRPAGNGGGGNNLAGLALPSLSGSGNGGGSGGNGAPLLAPIATSGGGGTGQPGGGGSSTGSSGGSSYSGFAADRGGNGGGTSGSSGESDGGGQPGSGPASPLAGAVPRSPLAAIAGRAASPGNGTSGTPIAGSSPASAANQSLLAPPPPYNPAQSRPDEPPTPSSPTTSSGQLRLPIPPGSAGGGGDGEPPDPIARYAPQGVQAPGPRKPVALRPARLNGDRDYVIWIECRDDCVLLYPSQRIFPLVALSRSAAPGNPLAVAVQQMIDRRQARVPEGAPPYRPQVCFLVRADAERGYHTAYPALDVLTVPKVRRNLGAQDDVLAIVTGH